MSNFKTNFKFAHRDESDAIIAVLTKQVMIRYRCESLSKASAKAWELYKSGVKSLDDNVIKGS